MSYMEPPFPFGGHQVRVILRDLPGDHNMGLDDFIGPAALMNSEAKPGSAKAITVLAGLKKLEVDGEEIPLRGRKNPLPNILDHSKRATLFDYVLGLIVKHNPQLLWKPAYSQVFLEHLQMVEDEDTEEDSEQSSELELLENPT